MEELLNANARAILDVVRATQNHPTALEVYERVRLLRPRIGLATVYRILHQLSEQGLINELGQNAECNRYDGRTGRHDHAICTTCGTLLDIPIEISLSSEVLQAAAQAAGCASPGPQPPRRTARPASPPPGTSTRPPGAPGPASPTEHHHRNVAAAWHHYSRTPRKSRQSRNVTTGGAV